MAAEMPGCQEKILLVCRDVTELTTDYLEGTLPWARRLALTFHLSICRFCRRHLRQVRATVGLLQRMPAPGQAVENAVMAQLARPPKPETEPPPSG
jgi:anti-sigma factor ChrR (cupin superfamily)